MRNLNDMNDLYNVQDVLFLVLEMVENRFEEMYQKNYNENVIQKCNP